MPSNSKDKIRIQHILDSILEIESYTKNINYQEFSKNSMMINASIRQLEIIGEASNHISDGLIAKHNSVEWKQIIGLRNFLIHEYFGIDLAVVWNVIKFDIPHFKNEINIIILEID